MTAAALSLPRIARKRRCYADRAGMHSRSARILAEAEAAKPVYTEDEDGHLIRDWSAPHERLTNDDLKVAIQRCHAVETADLLQYVSPGVIKYAEQQRWLVKQSGGFYRISAIAAKHLALPAKDRDGRKIRFVEA